MDSEPDGVVGGSGVVAVGPDRITMGRRAQLLNQIKVLWKRKQIERERTLVWAHSIHVRWLTLTGSFCDFHRSDQSFATLS